MEITKETIVARAMSKGWSQSSAEGIVASVIRDFAPKNQGYAFTYWNFMTKAQAEKFEGFEKGEI